MGNRKFIVLATVCLALIFSAGSVLAGTTVDDVIQMKNAAYKKHKKGICTFTHKKHVEEYKITCGECHHDDKGKPLTGLKMGDDVQNCIECHKIPSQMPGKLKKELKAAKASKAEVKAKKLEYHAEAIHMQCIDCHKAYNKKNKTKAAVASCKGCHPKMKK